MVHVYKEVKLQIMIFWFTTPRRPGVDSRQVSVEYILMTGHWHRFLPSAYFEFPLSLSFHHFSIQTHSSTTDIIQPYKLIKNDKLHPCTGTEALYRPYGP